MRLPASIKLTRLMRSDMLHVGLRVKVLIPATALSIAASLVLFGWFGQKLMTQSIEDLRSRLHFFSSTQAAELAEPIWVFDQMSIDRLFRSYAVNQDLLHAELYDAKENLLARAEGARPSGVFGTYVAVREIVRKSGEDTYHIGRLEVAYHDGNVRKSLANGRTANLITLLAVIALLAGATAFAIHWQVGSPLKSLRESLDRNKSRGLREPLEWSSRDELGEVVAAYNALLAEVDRQTRCLEDANASLERENSQRKKAEEELKRSEEQLNLVLEASRDGFWDCNIQTGEISLSPRGHEQLEYRVGDLEQSISGLKKLCHPDDFPRLMTAVNAHLRGVADTPYVEEHRFRAKSGKWRWILTRGKVFRDEQGKAVRMIGTVTDITGRKEAEEERDRLATALEQMDESVIITDIGGVIGYVNPAFEKIYGYRAEDAIGLNLDELDSGRPEEASHPKLWELLSEGAVWRGHIVQKRKDGASLELIATISPVRDSSGAVTNYVEIARDVSREIELQKQLQQAQKMEAIGTLAGGIAHDFNNILAAIIGYTEMALFKVSDSDPTHRHLSQVLKAAHRARDVVGQIVVISRSEVSRELSPLHLSGVVREVLSFLRATVPATVEIREDIRSEASVVMADRTQIHQVIMNLCTNAAHAMEESGGVLQVTLDEVDFEDGPAAAHLGLAAGSYLRLTVRDTGHGMDPPTLERIFDPYFTTKEVGKGSGLGLAVVQGIIKRHRGAISVSSEPGRGSIFRVHLPAIEEQPVPEKETCAHISGGAGRILFVDDEETLTEIGEEMLQQLGYEVLSETDGLRALIAFKNRPGDFDLVITDYTMPGMTGLDLAREILIIRPEIPIILCTGHSERATEDKVRKHGVRAFLMKPYGLNDLAAKVREALNDGALQCGKGA